MAWSGSWNANKTVFTGTLEASDGAIFEGTWTVLPHPPELSFYDPYVGHIGAASDSTIDKAWRDVTWNRERTAFTAKYRSPDGSLFEGKVTPPQERVAGLGRTLPI